MITRKPTNQKPSKVWVDCTDNDGRVTLNVEAVVIDNGIVELFGKDGYSIVYPLQRIRKLHIVPNDETHIFRDGDKFLGFT